MPGFSMELASSTRLQRHDGVQSFVGADASGRFGLLAGHEPLATVLDYGLASFRLADGAWHYLAFPGGVLRFADNRLAIATRTFVTGDSLDTVRIALEKELEQDASHQADLRHNLQQLEQALMQRLWRMESA
jgi:F-type H+-transporting ATPase subunit epsilon